MKKQLKTKWEMNEAISIRMKKLHKEHPEKFIKWHLKNKDGKFYKPKMKTYWVDKNQRREHLLGLLKYNQAKGFKTSNLEQKIKELDI